MLNNKISIKKLFVACPLLLAILSPLKASISTNHDKIYPHHEAIVNNEIDDDIQKENQRIKELLNILKDKPVTCILVALNIIIYFVESISCRFYNYAFNAHYILNDFKNNWCLLVTGAFFHFDIKHIGGNMAALYLVGGDLEKWYVKRWGAYKGRLLYLLLYTGSIIGAEIPSFIIKSNAPSRGASGGTHGLMAAYAIMYPSKKILGIPNCIFQPLYAFVTTYLIHDVFISNQGRFPRYNFRSFCTSSHGTHIAGALSGAILVVIMKYFIKAGDTYGKTTSEIAPSIHHQFITQIKLYPKGRFAMYKHSFL